MKSRFFSVGEVAKICSVSTDAVLQWIEGGELTEDPAHAGGERRVSHHHLKSFMTARNIPLERMGQDEICILVVDDDPYYLDIIPAVLSQDESFKVLTATTGFDAGLMVAENCPQAIILDIHLSDIDGRMVCERIKGRKETSNVRILGISGFIDEEETDGLSAYGFDDFLRKPFQIDELRTRIRKLLHLPS